MGVGIFVREKRKRLLFIAGSFANDKTDVHKIP